MSKKTLPIKQAKQKEQLTEQLNKVPVVHLACERTGISRATFYRWKKADQEFADAVDEAIASGASLINDLAESKLISAIQNGHMTGIIYWLKHHHPAYTTRVELAVGLKQNEELTPKQQAVVQKALALAALTESNIINKENYDE
ncbi:MAG: phBC6A51 family helix-turn-helix protein [Patescibacteria group bacterium]